MEPGQKRAKKTAPPQKKSTKSKNNIKVQKPRTKKTPPPKKKSKGRPKYEPSEEHLETAMFGAKKGLNEEQMAKAIGISIGTLRRNKDQFRSSIKKGRDMSDDRFCEKAESFLMKKIEGYYWEEKTQITKLVKGPGGKIITEIKNVEEKIVRKHVPGSDTLMMFYLVNRKPSRWRSINREGKGSDDNRGKIAKFFDEMELGYKKRIEENGPNSK